MEQSHQRVKEPQVHTEKETVNTFFESTKDEDVPSLFLQDLLHDFCEHIRLYSYFTFNNIIEAFCKCSPNLAYFISCSSYK